MLLLVLLAVVVAAVLGAAVVVVVWPALVLGAALLHCLDRPARRAARPLVAAALVAAAIVYDAGPWDVSPGSSAALYWFVAPLLAAGLLILAFGGPQRIRLRHARAEARRRELRAEAAAQARAARAASSAERRRARRAAVKQRTGLDVDLLTEVATTRIRVVGERITRRLERHRPARPADEGPPQWLDLDRDVAADLSHQRSEEILRLAGELDRTRPKPR